MRKFHPRPKDQDDRQIRPTLRTDKPAAAYARRSLSYTKDEKKDKSQSREMQTEDIKAWALEQRWKEKDFHPYFSDFGLSGTLRPDLRPDLLRLFDDMDSGMFDGGSVICYQESRLFRDETQIYYNQFIDKCKQHNIVVVVISPYLMIYDFRDDFLTEMFRWKCKEAADFIKRHIKGWMHPARFRAAWRDGEWAGLGNLPMGFIVDYDEHSPTYKKLVPYWPHAEKKRELRLLFVELGCDLSLLYRRLREAPIIFPEFESWVDSRNLGKFIMAKHPVGGYYPKDKATIKSMLTDPNDIGYRVVYGAIRHDSQGQKIIDHEPIVELDLFNLCYYALADIDLDGKPMKERKPRRYFHRGSKGEFGLLKYRIKSSEGEVVTHADGEYNGDTPPDGGSYIIRSLEKDFSLRHYITHAVIPCEEVDRLIVDRLMQHAGEISQNQEDVAEYERQTRQRRRERQSKLAQIDKSINDIDKDQSGLTRILGKLEVEIKEAEEAGDTVKKALKERRKQLTEEEIETLEIERTKLINAREQLERDSESDLGSLDEEIKQLAGSWSEYLFEKRRSLINFLVKEVVVDRASTHWMRIEILWLHEEWGREEIYYRRHVGANVLWTGEEDAILRSHYEITPRDQLMALLPDRGWVAIMQRSRVLGMVRRYTDSSPRPKPKGASYRDLEFIRNKGLPYEATRTNWERLFAQSRPASLPGPD